MKKIFLFAAAVAAALTVNAKTINFTGIVDKTDAASAQSTFEAAYDVTNITIAGKPNSKNTAYYAEITQVSKTEEWGITTAKLKSDAQAWFDFKDNEKDNKIVAKAWADYMQPNGKGMALVIGNLNAGDKVTITLKEELAVVPVVEGVEEAEVSFADAASVTVTATGNEIRMYSKDADNNKAAWKLVSVTIGAEAGINNTNAVVKNVKRIVDGQVVIERDGRMFNLLGAEIK